MTTKFDKTKLTILRADIDAALAAVAAKHGLTVQLGNCKYNDHNATYTSLTMTVASPDVDKFGFNPNSEEAKAYEHIRKYGDADTKSLPDLGTTFMSNALQHKIVGWARRRSKRPVMTVTPDGRKWIFPVEQVLYLVKRA